MPHILSLMSVAAKGRDNDCCVCCVEAYSPVTQGDAVNGLGCNAVMRPVNLSIEAAAAAEAATALAVLLAEAPQNSSVFCEGSTTITAYPMQAIYLPVPSVLQSTAYFPMKHPSLRPLDRLRNSLLFRG